MNYIIILTALILAGQILIVIILVNSQKTNDELLKQEFEKLGRDLRQEFYINRDEFSKNSKDLRNEVLIHFRTFSEIMSQSISTNGDQQRIHMEAFTQQLKNFQLLTTDSDNKNREQLNVSLKSFEDSIRLNLKDINEMLRLKLDSNNLAISELSKIIDSKLEKLRETLNNQLKTLQEENSRKLEEMRNTVDEKLQSTLEKRLSESFKQVSERLELVHKGLGEMQVLANGVGDLKKVLSNVKTRGILGEVQLGNILEQILTKDQFVTNVITRPDCRENVEFAIKLPGREESGKEVLLPIDSKFPLEDYYSLLEAYDTGESNCIQTAVKSLENTIKKVARDIRDKYIEPPHTTDFGIMFLPVEGLYAEVVRRTDLLEILQRDYKIIITGPTTLAAILHSLQMGFRTLAIEKRSSEVWKVLSAVKTEFGKFNDVLKKAQEKLNKASEDIDNLVGTRSRQIQIKLKNITSLPAEESRALLSDNNKFEEEAENSEREIS
jgi:DNA recombination protein RmuC